jgi:hypothetical protein
MSVFSSALRPGPVGQILEEAPEPGFGTQALNAGLSGISTIGQILDTFGGVVRGTIGAVTGQTEFERIFTGVFDSSERVTGNELIGKDKDKFSWLGLGVEIITDPLSYVTLGAASAAGKAAKTAGKLSAKKQVYRTLDELGERGAKKHADQAAARLREEQGKLVAMGRDAKEEFASSVRDQFASGQRNLVTLDIPFTKIATPLIANPAIAKHLGSGVDAISSVVGQLPISRALHKKFVTNKKDPVLEELRLARDRISRKGKQEARNVGQELAAHKARLSAVDELDLKAVKILESEGVALKSYTDAARAGKEADRLGILTDARVRVEEMYGEIDQFEEVWSYANRIRQLNEDVLRFEQAAGVPVKEFTELGYVARVMTPEGSQLLRESKKGRDILRKHFDSISVKGSQPFQKARNFRELGIEELNEKLAESYGKDPSAFKFFDTDLTSIQVNRLVQSSQAVSHARLAQATLLLRGKEATKAIKKGDSKAIKASKKAARANEVSVAKILRPRGPLVKAMQFAVDQTKEKVVAYAARGGNVRKGSTPGSIMVGTYEIAGDVVDKKIIDELAVYVGSAKTGSEEGARTAYAKLSPGHKNMLQHLDDMVEVGALQPEQAAFMRAYTAKFKGDTLDRIAFGTFDKEEMEIYKAYMGYGKDVDIAGIGGDGFTKDASVLDFGSEPGAYIRGDLAQRTPKTHPMGQLGEFTLMHEIGHAFMEGMADPETFRVISNVLGDFKAGIDNVYDQNELTEALSKLGIHKEIYNDNPAEMYATLFALWSMGTRSSNAVLERAFKTTADDYKNFRDLIHDRIIRPAVDPDTDDVLFAQPYQAVESMFPKMERSNAEVINAFPNQQKRMFLTDLADIPEQRRIWMDIPPDASKKQIKKLLREHGVVQEVVDKEAFEFVTDLMSKSKYHVDQDTWWGKTIRTMDQVHALYRTALTQYWPAFHARNFISNIFMNSMAGVHSPKHYVQAMRMMKNMSPEDALYYASLNVTDSGKIREIYDYMTASQGSLTNSMKDFLGKFKPAARAGTKAQEFSRTAGHAVENIGRMAHFLAKKAEGLSDLEAADSVTKYLFDYADLTDFERAVPRRGMLFYTFFRKNMPLMMEQTFKNPRFMMLYARATGNTNPNIPEPEWLPDSFFLNGSEYGQTIRLNFGLPPEDLARFDPQGEGLARMAELMIGNLAPAFKEPIQFVSEKDFFTGRPREGGALEYAVSTSPLSRAAGYIRNINDISSPEDGGKALGRFLTGTSVREIDPVIQKKLNRLEAVRDRLKEIARQGDGRVIEIVGNRSGMQNPELSQLNSMAARIQHDIRTQMEAQAPR